MERSSPADHGKPQHIRKGFSYAFPIGYDPKTAGPKQKKHESKALNPASHLKELRNVIKQPNSIIMQPTETGRLKTQYKDNRASVPLKMREPGEMHCNLQYILYTDFIQYIMMILCL